LPPARGRAALAERAPTAVCWGLGGAAQGADHPAPCVVLLPSPCGDLVQRTVG